MLIFLIKNINQIFKMDLKLLFYKIDKKLCLKNYVYNLKFYE